MLGRGLCFFALVAVHIVAVEADHAFVDPRPFRLTK
jgi:hypothetical protein